MSRRERDSKTETAQERQHTDNGQHQEGDHWFTDAHLLRELEHLLLRLQVSECAPVLIAGCRQIIVVLAASLRGGWGRRGDCSTGKRR